MPIMPWNDKFLVGVSTVDDDHKKLVAMLNNLYDAMQAGKGKDAMGQILDELVEYTKFHFGREETYFKEHGYPDTDKHLEEHAALAKQVLDVQAKYKAGATATLNMEVMNFLRNWLTNHINGSDKKFGPFFNAKGIK